MIERCGSAVRRLLAVLVCIGICCCLLSSSYAQSPAAKIESPRKAKVSWMTPEEARSLIRIPQSNITDMRPRRLLPSAPDATKLATSFRCPSIEIQADLMNSDGIDETYTMVSLLDCNGVNYVSTVKDQRGGSCMTSSATAALETMLGVQFDTLRPRTTDHPEADFLPVNLSEGYSLYSFHYFIDTETLAGIGTKRNWWGSAHDAYFPDPEMKWNWGDWDSRTADALKLRYGAISDYCKNIAEPQLDKDQLAILASNVKNNVKDPIWDVRFKPIFNCVFDVAKRKKLVFVGNPTEVALTADVCVNTATGWHAYCKNHEGAGEYGNSYQVDYTRTDISIKILISMGIPIRASVSWNWDQNRAQTVDNISPYYSFRRHYPSSLSVYASADGDYTINGTTYSFPHPHSVLIVGYLEGKDRDFWIIKNSYGVNAVGKKPKELFALVETASTSGDIAAAGSTKRNLFLAPGSQVYTYFSDISFYQLSESTNSTDAIIAGASPSHVNKDTDGDGVVDLFDNCPGLANANQADKDGDFVGDVCDPCPNDYDRYQEMCDPYLIANDPDGDGVPTTCDSSLDIGMALLEHGTGGMAATLNLWKPGDKIDGWNFGLRDVVKAVGDLDGDGLDEFVLQSDWGIGVGKVSGGSFKVYATLKYGNAISGYGAGDAYWPIKATDRLAGVGDFNGDGRKELVFLNDTGSTEKIAVIGLNTSKSWYSLSNEGSVWDGGAGKAAVGDFDGDGRDDLAIPGNDRLTLVKIGSDRRLESRTLANPGDWLGDWRYGVDNKILGVGDFDGDGRKDLIVQSKWGLGILGYTDSGKWKAMALVQAGTPIGKWRLGLNDKVEVVGDLNKDGRDELVLRSNWGIGVMALGTNKRLKLLAVRKHGEAMGDWSLGKQDSIRYAGDFDGDGRYEFVITSDWGLGVCGLRDAGLTSIAIHGNKSWLGKWFLRAGDVWLSAGSFTTPSKAGLLVKTSVNE